MTIIVQDGRALSPYTNTKPWPPPTPPDGELQYMVGGKIRDVKLGNYPDTMPLAPEVLYPPGPLRVLLRPRSFVSFVAAMFWIDALRERNAYTPELVLPFVPGARQDRLNAEGDQLFTIKSVARMINDRQFPRVTILDPHSDVTPALIDRCRVVHAADVINVPPGKYAAVISPDAGAEKRAGRVAAKLGVPLIHAWKTRNVATGAIDGFGFDADGIDKLVDEYSSVKPRVLIVDDICDGGGTFVGLAKEIENRLRGELDLHLFTTHGIYSKGVAPLAEHFSHIYCTDSILGERPGVIQINACKELLGQ
jgi:ribose-phosphate pyrophosphokinase